jgi:hypothetical protein
LNRSKKTLGDKFSKIKDEAVTIEVSPAISLCNFDSEYSQKNNQIGRYK